MRKWMCFTKWNLNNFPFLLKPDYSVTFMQLFVRWFAADEPFQCSLQCLIVSGSDWAEVYWTSRSARAGQQLCITSRSISINPIDCAEEWNCSCHSEITSPFDGLVPIPNQSLQNCYNTLGNFCVDFFVSHSQNKGWDI